MTAFAVSTDFDDNGTIVSVEGEIDIASTPELKAVLQPPARSEWS